MPEPQSSAKEIAELKAMVAELRGGAKFRNYILLALASAVLPIALTLASTSYSYTQKVGDANVVVIETKGWIGDLKDILGILAPVVAASPLLAAWIKSRQPKETEEKGEAKD